MKKVFAYHGNYEGAAGTAQVVNRKKYDTDSADLLWKTISETVEFQKFGLALFQKKNGEYFKYHCYWATFRSSYHYECGHPKITPLTDEQAKNLTEIYAPDKYIEIFGDVEE